MNKLFNLVIVFISLFSSAFATEFTISTYNCGGLSDHYDYLRAACMQKLMQQRYNAEPEMMAKAEKVQQLALKILFGKDPNDQAEAQRIWSEGGYQQLFERITSSPNQLGSPNASWHKLGNDMISDYKTRPVSLHDEEVNQMLQDHFNDLTKNLEIDLKGDDRNALLNQGRRIMAERIFSHQMKYDVICLQEADYLSSDMFPEHYQVEFSDDEDSINGIAWNKDRFELVEIIGNVMNRFFVVMLLDKESSKTVLIASGHLTGCNPFTTAVNPKTGASDSEKGDNELKAICARFDTLSADIKLIGMDSNVTATHPRLKVVKEFGYRIDGENFLEPTCTNPYQVLNTRIDWIALKSSQELNADVTNIPVMGVGLNSVQTNISDHKPIAASVHY